jgi:hypothetical protein
MITNEKVVPVSLIKRRIDLCSGLILLLIGITGLTAYIFVSIPSFILYTLAGISIGTEGMSLLVEIPPIVSNGEKTS